MLFSPLPVSMIVRVSTLQSAFKEYYFADQKLTNCIFIGLCFGLCLPTLNSKLKVVVWMHLSSGCPPLQKPV